MKPADVPVGVVEAMRQASLSWDEDGAVTYWRHVITAAWPEIERQVRAKVADEARSFADQFGAARSLAMASDAATLRWFADRLDTPAAGAVRGEQP